MRKEGWFIMSRFHIYDKGKILELLHLLDDKLTAVLILPSPLIIFAGL